MLVAVTTGAVWSSTVIVWFRLLLLPQAFYGRRFPKAKALVGTHDFSAFRAAECQAKSPTKTLTEVAIAVDGEHVRFDFRADAFLQHMIRNVVGSLVYVGAGKHPPGWIAELLAGRDRTRAAPTFAPDGLYFTGADYDAKWAIPPTRRPVVLPRGSPRESR